MDNTKEFKTCVEWFAGYTGNHLGLKRAIPDLRLIALCEREAFVCANLVSKMEKGLMEPVPIWTNCEDFPIKSFENRVDVFIASYPCQPFSSAGQRRGAEDDRHLWPHVRRFITGARPRYVFLENVEGHISLGLSTVLSDLEEDSYRTSWGIFSASEVGAPHQRKRVFILAHDARFGTERLSWGYEKALPKFGKHLYDESQSWPARPGNEQYHWEPPRIVEDACSVRWGRRGKKVGRLQESGTTEIQTEGSSALEEVADTESDGQRGRAKERQESEPAWPGEGHGYKEKIEPPMGRNFNGITYGLDFTRLPWVSYKELAEVDLTMEEAKEIYNWQTKNTNRVDELRMCGNGVVPATAEVAWRVLFQELQQNNN